MLRLLSLQANVSVLLATLWYPSLYQLLQLTYYASFPSNKIY